MAADALQLDAAHPWPGLASYDESAQAFFHGREDETAALARLIRQAPLTVLYGRSGLGKSSLLMAGLFPLLREQAHLPVYLRLDFSDHAREAPMEQIARRLAEEIAAAGLEGPPRQLGESLWHWLHRQDFELWSSDNRLWTPVLVLDQFEELFSRSGGNMQRISEVFDALADLAENRLERGVADSRRGRDGLDLIGQRYRMLLSFREDFLPDIRAWQRQVPSLLRNDLRLVPMTRDQAAAAVRRAGAAVLAPGAADQLVDFVGALGASRQHADDGSTTISGRRAQLTIEPALLSLCGEQLVRRLVPGKKIDRDLLASAGFDILEGFYRDALADLPDSVHSFIEEHLLQGDRTRGSYARDEALAQGFITAEQLAVLTTQRRLLRVAQDGGVPRIELIHDRLVDVVRAARDRRAAQRQAEAGREAERLEAERRLAAEQAQRLASEQRARQMAEASARSLRRSRTGLAVAFGLALLMLGTALWQAWQATLARDDTQKALVKAQEALSLAEDEKRVANAARNAAIEQASLAEERRRQATLLASYGWVADTRKGLDETRVQEALRADEALRSLRGAPAATASLPGRTRAITVPPSAPIGAGGSAEPRGAARFAGPEVSIELFAKDVDQGKVDEALRALGYPISRPRARLDSAPTNTIWYGSAVPDEDVRVVALALMRAGVALREIAPIRDTPGKRDLPLIQVGTSLRVKDAPVWSVDRVMAHQVRR